MDNAVSASHARKQHNLIKSRIAEFSRKGKIYPKEIFGDSYGWWVRENDACNEENEEMADESIAAGIGQLDLSFDFKKALLKLSRFWIRVKDTARSAVPYVMKLGRIVIKTFLRFTGYVLQNFPQMTTGMVAGAFFAALPVLLPGVGGTFFSIVSKFTVPLFSISGLTKDMNISGIFTAFFGAVGTKILDEFCSSEEKDTEEEI